MTKKIALLGSTGSIGVNTLNVVRHLGEDASIAALAAHSNIDLLEKQVQEFRPSLIAVFDPVKAAELRLRLPRQEILSGMEGLKAVAGHTEANFVVSAISGTLGLEPTVAALKAGKDVGLANKEALVSGGSLVTSLAHQNKCRLLPIDSEHSAIFQCLEGEKKNALKRIILTASGGPFRNYTADQITSITVETALGHPTWKMGPKITVDSSTLMNKGLEMIEAHWLFDLSPKAIDIVVHPQSIIHSLVEFIDGAMLAQMSEPSMTLPIQYAITYPERKQGFMRPFDFLKNNTLQFFEPDKQKFRCLQLAYDSLKVGKSLPCYMNAANEVLVHAFLDGKLKWHQIAEKLQYLMESHQTTSVDTLEEILNVDALARQDASKVC